MSDTPDGMIGPRSFCNHCKIMQVISCRHPDVPAGKLVLFEREQHEGLIASVVNHNWPGPNGKSIIETRTVWFAKDELKPYTPPSELIDILQHVYETEQKGTCTSAT